MLSLVEHFGDQQDSGKPCGLCDVCAPAACIKAQRPSSGYAPLSSQAKPDGKRAGKSSKRRGSKTSRRRTSRSSSSRSRSSRSSKSRSPAVAIPATGPSAPLAATLRAWRLKEANKKRVPAFRVLTNRALVAIAEARPESASSLRAITGIGPKLVQTYGAQLVALCCK